MIEDLLAAFGGGVVIAALGGFLIGALIIGIALYVYTALALMTIADKKGHPHPWVAWIPLANAALFIQLGGFHWAWIFITLVPWIGGFVFMILTLVAFYRITEESGIVPGWTAILTIIPGIGYIWGLVLLGLLAWKK